VPARRDDLYLLGIEAFERGDHERAERLLGDFLASGHPYPDVLNRLGLLAHERGDFKSALQRFQEALALNPRYNEAALNLAITLMDLGRYDDAERAYRRARPGAGADGLDPYVKGKLANRQADLAGTYHALGLLEEAIAAFETALALCPGFPDVRLRLGIALRDAGRLDDALVEFDRVRTDAPHLAMAGVQLGITRYAAGDHAGAVAEWQAVLESHPGHPRAQMYLRLVPASRPRRSAG
jgi:tetratricopeptide (TPR) repeat protein